MIVLGARRHRSSARVIWGVDFRTVTDGALSSLPGGLSFARASSATVTTGPSTVITSGITSNVARVGKRGSDSTTRGLLFEGARTNLLAPNGRAVNSLASAGSGATITANDIAGPDGSVSADRVQLTSGGYSRYQTFSLTTGAKYTVSIWFKGSGPFQTNTFGVAAHANVGTLSSSWTCVSYTFTQDSTSGGFIPLDTRNNGVGSGWPQAIDAWVDLMQIEAGAYETSYFNGARAGERLYLASRAPLLRGGRLRLRVRSLMRFASADMKRARRLWTIDANNYVEVDTSRNVVAVVGGSSVTLPTAIPSWSVSDVLDLRVDVGNGAPRGSASINDGAATSLGTGAGSHSAIAASGGIDLLCSSTSSQWEGWIQVMQALAA